MGLGERVWLLFPQPASVAAETRPGPSLLDGFAITADGERPEDEHDPGGPRDRLEHERRGRRRVREELGVVAEEQGS